jgi:hypothetical protein
VRDRHLKFHEDRDNLWTGIAPGVAVDIIKVTPMRIG